ncbi:MAG: hypothetical protein ACE5E5_01060 [Phycisphaerae bacterium]
MQPGSRDRQTIAHPSRSALRRVGVPVLAVVVAIPYYLPRICLATSATSLRRYVSAPCVAADVPRALAPRAIVATQAGSVAGSPRLSHRGVAICEARPARQVRIMHIGGLHGP